MGETMQFILPVFKDTVVILILATGFEYTYRYAARIRLQLQDESSYPWPLRVSVLSSVVAQSGST